MNTKPKETLLSEEDNQRVLDIVARLNKCHNRGEFNNVILSNLLPWLNAQSILFVQSNGGLTPLQIFDCVSKNENFSHEGSASSSMENREGRLYNHSLRNPPVNSDHAENRVQGQVSTLPIEKPSTSMKSSEMMGQKQTIGFNLQEMAFGLTIYREVPLNETWTTQDIRRMKLVGPFLLQTVRSITMKEELEKYHTFAEALADIPMGIALISQDMRVIFQNKVFEKMFSIQGGRSLPQELREVWEREMAENDQGPENVPAVMEVPYFVLPQGVFELRFTLLDSRISGQGKWLLRMKPMVGQDSKMSKLIHESTLTTREKQIVSLIHAGLDDREIAKMLIISLHTVKTHLKKIHEKLGVHSRMQLIALLNK